MPEMMPAPWQALRDRGVERTFPAGAVLYVAGSDADGMYFILSGRVRVMRGGGGNRPHIIHEEAAGGTLGDVPVFEGTTYPATAIAAEPTRCLFVSRDAVIDAIRAEPDIAVALLERLAARVRALVEQLDQRTGFAIRERVAGIIIGRAATRTVPDAAFSLGATHQEIAESLGTVREIVVRSLRELRDDGILEAVGRGRYIIRDEKRLMQIASQDNTERAGRA
jgi:CRP/FNR family transcriptional regulator